MKKFLCLLLAAVLAGLLILPCAAAEPTDFTDRSTIRNYNAVRMLADLGLVAGYSDGSFGPDKLIRIVDSSFCFGRPMPCKVRLGAGLLDEHALPADT